MLNYLAAVAAVILFFIGALLLFGWFATTPNIGKGLGFDSLGLIALILAIIIPERVRPNA